MGILRHKRQTSWFEVDQVALAGSVQETLQDFSKTIRETLDLLPNKVYLQRFLFQTRTKDLKFKIETKVLFCAQKIGTKSAC